MSSVGPTLRSCLVVFCLDSPTDPFSPAYAENTSSPPHRLLFFFLGLRFTSLLVQVTAWDENDLGFDFRVRFISRGEMIPGFSCIGGTQNTPFIWEKEKCHRYCESFRGVSAVFSLHFTEPSVCFCSFLLFLLPALVSVIFTPPISVAFSLFFS